MSESFMKYDEKKRPGIVSPDGCLQDPSWNDLKDKPFYVEEVEEVVLPRTEIYVGGSAKLCYEGESGYIATPFVAGRKYTVVFDGTEYDCLAYDLAQNSVGLTAIVLGNPYLVSDAFPYIDMPFVIFSNIDADGDWYTRHTVKTSGTHTFEIRQKVEKTYTLDPKYLPCDLMFKVGCAPNAHPKYEAANMTKPTIVSGSLEAVLEKLANGEIPVVKVQYQAYGEYSGGFKSGYGAEYICDTFVYGTNVMFAHDIPHPLQELTVQIAMDADDPTVMEMTIWSYNTASTPSVVIS